MYELFAWTFESQTKTNIIHKNVLFSKKFWLFSFRYTFIRVELKVSSFACCSRLYGHCTATLMKCIKSFRNRQLTKTRVSIQTLILFLGLPLAGENKRPAKHIFQSLDIRDMRIWCSYYYFIVKFVHMISKSTIQENYRKYRYILSGSKLDHSIPGFARRQTK